jgi:hypothetical protein
MHSEIPVKNSAERLHSYHKLYCYDAMHSSGSFTDIFHFQGRRLSQEGYQQE